MLKVAVLISVYNKDRPDWFAAALDSIFSQVIDAKINVYLGIDGPIGDSLEQVLKLFSHQIHKTVRSPENLGLTQMLNRLIGELEDEEFIFRADADDISHPLRFQSQIDFMLKNPQIDVLGTAIEEINEFGEVILKKVSYPLTHKDCREFFKRRDPLAHPAVLFRKSFFVKAGSYNNAHRTNQDTYMWLQGFLFGCQFANLDGVFLSFRRSSDFYQRRSGINRAWQLLKMRLEIARKMHFSADAYIYALLFFIFTLLPGPIKKMSYQYLR